MSLTHLNAPRPALTSTTRRIAAPLPKLWEALKISTKMRITNEARRATQRISILVRAILVNRQCHWAWDGNYHHDNKMSWASLLKRKKTLSSLQRWFGHKVGKSVLSQFCDFDRWFCDGPNFVIITNLAMITKLWQSQNCDNHKIVIITILWQSQIVRWSCKQHINR